MSNVKKCDRCGKIAGKWSYEIKTYAPSLRWNEYDVCEDCFVSFRHWMNNPEDTDGNATGKENMLSRIKRWLNG